MERLNNKLPLIGAVLLGVALALTITPDQQTSKTSSVEPVPPVPTGAPPMPEAPLLRVNAWCDGPVPVVDVVGLAKRQMFDISQIDLLVIERGRNFRILGEWTGGEYLSRTYRGFAPEVGIYRDMPVAPLELLEGKQYRVSVKSYALGTKNGRRDVKSIREIYSRSVTIPECTAKPRWSKH